MTAVPHWCELVSMAIRWVKTSGKFKAASFDGRGEDWPISYDGRYWALETGAPSAIYGPAHGR